MGAAPSPALHAPLSTTPAAATTAPTPHDAAATHVVGCNFHGGTPFFPPEQMEDNMPAVPMTRLPRIRAACRLLPLMLGLALPLTACTHGKFWEDFCISCAGEAHADAGAPATDTTGGRKGGPGASAQAAPSQGPAATGTSHM